MDVSGNGKCISNGIKKGLRKGLDVSGSFHQSLNGSLANLSISLSASPSRGKSEKNKLNKSGSRSTKTPVADRFVPVRSNYEMAHYLLSTADANRSLKSEGSSGSGEASSENSEKEKKNNSMYSKSLTETMLGVSDINSVRVLAFAQKPKCPPEGYQNALKVVYQGSTTTRDIIEGKYRVYPKSPDRVLDAPDIVDDFYLNLLDWSSTNVVAIALREQVYLWTAHTAEIQRIPCDNVADTLYVSSVGWLQDGNHLVCATDKGKMQVWDVERVKMIRNLRSNEPERIAAMSFRAHTLTEGNRLGILRHHDLRIAEHEVMKREGAHAQEICGVRWSPDGRFCATGGNDNTVNVWDSLNMSNNCQPVCTFSDHQAAIKALCWSPNHSNVLASGGGTNDRTIKLWNVSSGTLLKSVNAESQVSSILWSESYREILSSHGFTKNQLTLWKYPEMSKIGEMMGHSMRILQMAMSPDETTVATVGADETLRFWRIFPPTKTAKDMKSVKTKATSVLNGFHGVR